VKHRSIPSISEGGSRLPSVFSICVGALPSGLIPSVHVESSGWRKERPLVSFDAAEASCALVRPTTGGRRDPPCDTLAGNMGCLCLIALGREIPPVNRAMFEQFSDRLTESGESQDVARTRV
jgi:hypothetical protein